MSAPDVLYHWAPSVRRKGIRRYGLVPGKSSVDGLWRPPFVCYCGDPMTAWALSGAIHPEVEQWDLWAVWQEVITGMESIPYDDGTPKEWRVYERVYARDVVFLGTRDQAVPL